MIGEVQPTPIGYGMISLKDLNSADWGRIEAALHDMVEQVTALPAEPAYRRTLDKVQQHNQTGVYTPQISH